VSPGLAGEFGWVEPPTDMTDATGWSLKNGYGGINSPMEEDISSADIDGLWDYGDPAASEVRFRELLASVSSTASRHEIRTQIARSLGLQRRFDEALLELEAVPDDSATLRVRKALEWGRVLNSSGRPGEAVPWFETALRESEGIAELEYYHVDAAHMLGIAAPAEDRLRWNLRAIDLARSASDERARGWLGSLLNNTGWSLHDLGRFEEAHALFVEALEYRRIHGSPTTVRIAHWCVGRSLRSLGRLDEALAIQSGLVSAGNDDEGYAHEEMGELLLQMERGDEAKPYFEVAHERLSKDPWLSANEPQRIERLATLSR